MFCCGKKDPADEHFRGRCHVTGASVTYVPRVYLLRFGSCSPPDWLKADNELSLGKHSIEFVVLAPESESMAFGVSYSATWTSVLANMSCPSLTPSQVGSLLMFDSHHDNALASSRSKSPGNLSAARSNLSASRSVRLDWEK
ncbi:uncharacterized protein CLUP02_01581 [Colletotrichum lupini]|uniref:Uncharacterized protein n=1 Tax=Colletotrichum lupini TaxID=145971 RepID=A0A9Q8SD87_9PEZI|nr:uncharacterized protein CLUP02_01581 [Colletotrichum lupini]UQC74928.1 hypothetical protein CLUP02_01581 [Colletotrichum lupini]